MVFQGRKESREAGHDHGLIVTITTARGASHGPAMVASSCCARPVFGQWAPRVPVVLSMARGNPVFSCAHEEVPVFVPLHVCTRQFYPDKVFFLGIIRLLQIEDEGTQSQERKNLIE